MRPRVLGLMPLFVLTGILLTSGVVKGQAVRENDQAREHARSAHPRAQPGAHTFWDRTNLALFASVGATRALDYTSTRHFRAKGVHERLLTDAIVDNRPLFIGIEAAGTAASLGVAYWLHKTAHHRLERWVSIVHIGAGSFGNIRNYNLGGRAQTPISP